MNFFIPRTDICKNHEGGISRVKWITFIKIYATGVDTFYFRIDVCNLCNLLFQTQVLTVADSGHARKQIILFPQYNILFPQLIILFTQERYVVVPTTYHIVPSTYYY